jgi:hypothetical protein
MFNLFGSLLLNPEWKSNLIGPERFILVINIFQENLSIDLWETKDKQPDYHDVQYWNIIKTQL